MRYILDSRLGIGASTMFFEAGKVSELDDICRSLMALCVSVLNLNSDVTNLELLVKLVSNLVKKLVARRRLRHDEMSGQRDFGGAHGPNMEIVDGLDALSATKIYFNRVRVNAFGNGTHRKIDGLA